MNKAFVFDFDDTLVKTDCKVLVRSDFDNSIVRRLTPAEYNSHELQNNCYYDFSEFSEVLEPKALFVMHLLKEVHAENHTIIILTARQSPAADAIKTYLESEGVTAHEICCVGDAGEKIEIEKAKVLNRLMLTHDKVFFYDDHHANVEEAKKLGVKANLV